MLYLPITAEWICCRENTAMHQKGTTAEVTSQAVNTWAATVVTRATLPPSGNFSEQDQLACPATVLLQALVYTILPKRTITQHKVQHNTKDTQNEKIYTVSFYSRHPVSREFPQY